MAVAAALFTRVYDPSYGMINQVIHALGFTDIKPQWLGDGRIAIYAAMGVFVWHETAFCYIVFTAAIQQIDRSLYDAAKVDGASEVQVFRYITIPSVRDVATFRHDDHADCRLDALRRRLPVNHARPWRSLLLNGNLADAHFQEGANGL